MDANRFDQFTRWLADAPSRRSLLSMAVGGGLGSLLGLTDLEAKKRKKGKGKGKKGKKKKGKGKGKPKGAQCRTSQSADTVTTTATFKQEDLTLTTVDEVPVDPREPLIRTLTIRQKQALLVESEFTLDPGGSVEVRVTNGKGYRGFSEALLTINAGMMSGSIDGRAFVPFPTGEAPESVQFQDGQPGPEISIGDKLQESIAKAVDQSLTKHPTCESASAGGKQTRGPRDHDGDGDCALCKARCLWDELVCGNGVRGVCAPLNGVFPIGPALYWGCVGLALVGCVDRALECLNTCRRNRDCCPVLCGTLPDWSCCHSNEQCLTFGTGLGQCCAPGETACHEKECCKPGETCLPGGICCRGPVCGDNCCGAFAFCCGGQCCTGSCNGNICCPAGQSSCGSGCCANVCCNGDCCGPDQICENGQCKTPTTCAFICNGQCCQQGDVCCQDFECRHSSICPD